MKEISKKVVLKKAKAKLYSLADSVIPYDSYLEALDIRAVSLAEFASSSYARIQSEQQEEIRKLAKEAMAHQDKCWADARHFLALYWSDYNGKSGGSHTLQIEKMREWLAVNQPFDRWFYVCLIEAAGEKALEFGYAQHKSEIAKSKNARPRAWVLDAWQNRTDKEQGKAAFARQYAPLVKSQFRLVVTADTIARDWLPKVKN